MSQNLEFVVSPKTQKPKHPDNKTFFSSNKGIYSKSIRGCDEAKYNFLVDITFNKNEC